MAAVKKKAGPFHYLNPANIQKEVNRFGYSFSLSGFWKYFVLTFIGIFVLCKIYGLHLGFTLFVMIFSIFLAPSVILNTYRNQYEQKRFSDLTNYLEQILYSFRRVPKILNALQDAMVVFPNGKMNELIKTTIYNIQNRPLEEGDSIYENAFQEMEEYYGCRRLIQAHNFLVKVETLGGDYSRSIDILIEDRRLWLERVYELEKERKGLMTKITISLILSFVICGSAMLMLPGDFGTLDTIVCQLVTTAFITGDILIWYFARKKLSADWLDDWLEDVGRIDRNYDLVVNYDPKKENRESVIMVMAFLIISISGIAVHSTNITIIGILLMIYAFFHSNLRLKSARKYILREINKGFPVWIMELSLLLQTENPHVALSRSIEQAPHVLKASLIKLVEELEKNPTQIEPYLQFMPKFDMPDIQSAMRLLYSMSEFGSEDAGKQIGTLVERNNRLMDKAERMVNEDSIAGTGALALVPMLTGSVKLMADLGMFLVAMLGMTGNM